MPGGIVSLAIVNVAFWPRLEGSVALRSFEDMGEALEAFGAQVAALVGLGLVAVDRRGVRAA